MARQGLPSGAPRSRLAQARHARNVRQQDLAQAIGMSIASYRRLESGQMNNPPFRYLMNCAIALGVKVDDLIEPEWGRWWDGGGARQPPDRAELWRDGMTGEPWTEVSSRFRPPELES
jgi:transcriptional regulator with XRE-family HTH domain